MRCFPEPSGHTTLAAVVCAVFQRTAARPLRLLASLRALFLRPPTADDVPQLIIELKDEDPRVRAAASEALGYIGPAAVDAVPQLIAARGDEDGWVEVLASIALERIGAEEVDALPQLIIALKDEVARVRAAASKALGKIGPAAAAAVPELGIALKDEDARVRAAASEALGKIGPAAVVPGLLIALKDEDARVRAAASEAFGKIGPAAAHADAVPQLMIALGDEEAGVRALAVEVLGKIGPAATEAVPQMIIALQDEDARVRALAAEALGKIGSAAADAVQQLISALEDEDGKVRARASESLGLVGPASRGVVNQPCSTAASVGGVLEKRIASRDGAAPLLSTELCDEGFDVQSRAASLPRGDVVDRLAQADPRDKAHGIMLQHALSMHWKGDASLDRIVARAVVHTIWCCPSKDVSRCALKALPESMKMLELSTFQQRWLVQRALQMWPDEAVEWKLHELLLEPKWGDDSLYAAEQAISEAGSNQLPGLGPVDTDASLSYLRDESVACSSGDGVPPAMRACPWSQSSVASA